MAGKLRYFALLGVVACCLLSTPVIHAQTSAQPISRAQLVKSLADKRAFDELLDLAVRDPDPELRRLAVVQITRLRGDGSTLARLNLYQQTTDEKVKTLLIDSLARFNEIEPLVQIASWEQDEKPQLQALRRIKYMKENSESTEIKDLDVSLLREKLDKVSGEPSPPHEDRPQRRKER
jgi:hypothetical protein